MMANAAFLAAVTVFLLVGWIAGELRFLAPYKALLFREHAALIGGAILILFLDLTATYYCVARWFFLRDTGRMTVEQVVRRHFGEDAGSVGFWRKSVTVATDKIAAFRRQAEEVPR